MENSSLDKSIGSTNQGLNLRIKQLRMMTGMSQKEFAGSVGLSQGHLCVIEKGDQALSEALLMAICHRHNVNEGWLFSGEGDIFANRLKDLGIPVYEHLPEGYPDAVGEGEAAGFISLPGIPEGSFAVFQRGDYMAPTIRDRDLVILGQDVSIKNDELVLLKNKWGTWFLRRFRQLGEVAQLSTDNSDYKAFDYDPAEQIIFAKVIMVMRTVHF